mmetsp:Transcript_36723/g.79388  ORF Transcript_36723/g.79388 Transcript_36723/m.79388 type:complete len:217 (-) Transcript_36723:32-682(-)
MGCGHSRRCHCRALRQGCGQGVWFQGRPMVCSASRDSECISRPWHCRHRHSSQELQTHHHRPRLSWSCGDGPWSYSAAQCAGSASPWHRTQTEVELASLVAGSSGGCSRHRRHLHGHQGPRRPRRRRQTPQNAHNLLRCVPRFSSDLGRDPRSDPQEAQASCRRRRFTRHGDGPARQDKHHAQLQRTPSPVRPVCPVRRARVSQGTGAERPVKNDQ